MNSMTRVGHEYEDSMGVYPGAGCPEYRAMMNKKSPYDQMVEAQNARLIATSNHEVVKSNDQLVKGSNHLADRVAALNQRIAILQAEDEVVELAHEVLERYGAADSASAEKIKSWLQGDTDSRSKCCKKVK